MTNFKNEAGLYKIGLEALAGTPDPLPRLRQSLTYDQTTNNGDTQRPAQLRSRVATECQRRGAKDADITIFDPSTVREQATYQDPDRPSRDINYVLVNGTLVIDNGKILLGVAQENGYAIRRNNLGRNSPKLAHLLASDRLPRPGVSLHSRIRAGAEHAAFPIQHDHGV